MQPLNSYKWKRQKSSMSFWKIIPRISVPHVNADYFKAFFFVCGGVSLVGILFFSAFTAYKIITFEELKVSELKEYIDYKIYPVAANMELVKEEVDFLRANAQIVEHRLKIRKYSIKNVNGKNKLVYE